MTGAGKDDRSRYQDRMDPAMIPILKAMSPQDRLKIADAMLCFAREELARMIRGKHPSWSDESVAQEVASRLLRGEGESISMDLSSFIRS